MGPIKKEITDCDVFVMVTCNRLVSKAVMTEVYGGDSVEFRDVVSGRVVMRRFGPVDTDE